MYKNRQKFYMVVAVVLTLAFTGTAFASLTLTTNAITGDTASAIDLGTGNALSIQTTGNGAITMGTGLVTMGGNLSVAGSSVIPAITGNTSISGVISAGGTAIDSRKYINVNVTGIDSTPGSSYGGYFSLAGNGNNENSLIAVRGEATRTSGAFSHGAVVGVLGKSLLSGGITTDNMVSVTGETQVQGTVNQAYGITGQVLTYGSGSVAQAYGVYADVVPIQTSSIADAYGARILVRQSGTSAVTRAYGLAISGWTGTAGTSYGIYIDNSIGIGTTKYSIYSASTANSYLAGNVGIGKTSPGSKLSVVGLPAYATNAAALAGGLTAGDFYYTDTGGEYIVKIAH